jgi:hypothetical protein
MLTGQDPYYQSEHVTVQHTAAGWIITQDENGDTEMLVPFPGWYFNFVPDRDAGE